MVKYLCLFAQEFVDFRIQELQAICEFFRIDVHIDTNSYQESKPYLKIELANENAARKILSRNILLKSISELFVDANSYEELNVLDSAWKKQFNESFHDNEKSFKFEVDVFNKKLTLEQRVEHIEELQEYVDIPGDVDLKNPENTFTLAVDFEKGHMRHFYFGKLIGYSQRQVIHKYNLKKRYFIGNTSMDPQLSLIMANQAHVDKGRFCFDPFVGTGSIIVACAHFGAICGGGDIDYNIIYGRGKSSRAGNRNFRSRDEIIRTNFDNYGLSPFYWDIMACDSTYLPFRVGEIFDAIVTDPPYGIREGGRKLGSKKDTVWEISEEIYSEEMLPQHPAFTLLANSQQHLTKTVARRLITMKKVKSFNEEAVKDVSKDKRRSKDVWGIAGGKLNYSLRIGLLSHKAYKNLQKRYETYAT